MSDEEDWSVNVLENSVRVAPLLHIRSDLCRCAERLIQAWTRTATRQDKQQRERLLEHVNSCPHCIAARCAARMT